VLVKKCMVTETAAAERKATNTTAFSKTLAQALEPCTPELAKCNRAKFVLVISALAENAFAGCHTETSADS
jgi:hypothetical protein